MSLDFAFAALALLLATASLATALWGKSAWLHPLSNTSWAGILAGFLALYFATTAHLPSALSTAAFAMIATLPTRLHDPQARRIASALTAAVASVVAIGALWWSTQWTEVPTRQMDQGVVVLLTALLCALGVTTALTLQATALQAGRELHRVCAAWMTAMGVSVAATGLLRGTLPGWDWALPLEGVRWQIPVALGAAKGFGFDLYMSLPGMTLVLLLLCLGCLTIALLPKIPRLLWVLPLGLGATGLTLILRAMAAPTLPPLAPIKAYASTVRSSQGIPETIVAQGQVVGTLRGISAASVLPELGMLAVVCVLALVALRFGDIKKEVAQRNQCTPPPLGQGSCPSRPGHRLGKPDVGDAPHLAHDLHLRLQRSCPVVGHRRAAGHERHGPPDAHAPRACAPGQRLKLGRDLGPWVGRGAGVWACVRLDIVEESQKG